MKCVLVLLTTISFAFGQDTGNLEMNMEATDLEMLQYERYQKPFDEKGLIQVTFNDVDTYFPTIRSYEIYAEECYNDSTEKLGYYWYFGDDKSFIECDEMVALLRVPHEPECKKVWFHTEPTFLGFIEWLEEKKNDYL